MPRRSAGRIRGAHPRVAVDDVYAAAVLGDFASWSGFFESAHQPAPTFESVLYGAAGVAHNAELTRLLLARGADPNLGGEVAYHAGGRARAVPSSRFYDRAARRRLVLRDAIAW